MEMAVAVLEWCGDPRITVFVLARTIAAAATSVEVGMTSAPLVSTITFNHPFFFAIREMKSGLIVFAGTVNDPTK